MFHLPALRADKKTKVITLLVEKKISCESQVYGKVIIDYTKDGDIRMIRLLPFSLDDFMEPEKLQKPLRSIEAVGL